MWIHLVDLFMIWWNIVVHILATLDPANLVLFVRIQAPNAGFHSIVKQRVSFREIDNIHSNHISHIFRISHTKEEPLQVTATVGVISHPYIELFVWPLPHLVDITAFKAAIEQDAFVIGVLGASLRPYAWIVAQFQNAFYFSRVVGQVILVTFSIDNVFVPWPSNFIVFNMHLFKILLFLFSLFISRQRWTIPVRSCSIRLR